jgi:hypothetical protein
MIYSFSSELYEQLEEGLKSIENSLKNDSERLDSYNICIGHNLKMLEDFIVDNGFKDETEEIYFFKYVYPRFYSWYIYHSEREGMLKLLPRHGTDVMIRDFFIQEYHFQLRFFEQHRAVYEYYLADDEDRDAMFFLSKNYKALTPIPPNMPFDSRFLTNQGYKFAKFIAYDRLQEYTGRRLRLLYRNPESEYVQALLKGSKRRWTGDKIELIEIAYGIYYTRRMNDGKVEVRDIVEWLEDTLGVDLGDAYRMFADLQRRKNSSYTKYLEEMMSAVQEQILEKDRFKASKRKLNRQK